MKRGYPPEGMHVGDDFRHSTAISEPNRDIQPDAIDEKSRKGFDGVV